MKRSIKNCPDKHGAQWTKDDEAQLCEEVQLQNCNDSAIDWDIIAEAMSRTPLACQLQWNKMGGLWTEDYDQYLMSLIDWDQVSEYLNKTETVCKRRLVSLLNESYKDKKIDWTKDMQNQLIGLVGGYDPFDRIDWKQVSDDMNIPQKYCKSQYETLFDECSQLLQKLNVIKQGGTEVISKILKDKVIECHKCQGRFIEMTYIWGGNRYCINCYKQDVVPKIDKMWEDIRSRDKCNCCAFCGKQRVQGSALGFHFDHINQFDKRACVFEMVRKGMEKEEIEEELERCQHLCKQCHAIVTCVEQKVGFHNLKRKYKKNKNNEMLKKMAEIYDQYMVNCIYGIIKEFVKC